MSNKSLPQVFIVWPVLVFLVITLASVAFGSMDINWKGWERASCWTEGCFCEGVRHGAVWQPSNTYSNLSYVLVGLLIISTAGRYSRLLTVSQQVGRRILHWRDIFLGRNLMNSHPGYPILYGISVITTGLGSLFYHASLSLTGQWFDLMGMYLLVGFVVVYNLSRLNNLSNRSFLILYILLAGGLGIFEALKPGLGGGVFGLFLVAGMILEIKNLTLRRFSTRSVFFFAALALFILAYVIWNLDTSGILCAPESWLQGHAAWHLLTASAAGALFLYYRSETSPPDDLAKF